MRSIDRPIIAYKKRKFENSEPQIIAEIKVKDIMSAPAVTINENACVAMVALLMKRHGIGCIIVTNNEDQPLGIVTERDLVLRVLSNMIDSTFAARVLTCNDQSTMITAKDVMTTPVAKVKPEESLIKAAKSMRLRGIRRLGVVTKDKIVGVITSKDILATTPELIEILQEKAEILENDLRSPVETNPTGYCDQCKNFSDYLTQTDGDFLCEDCRN